MRHSYMVIDKSTNAVVFELWDCGLLVHLNTKKYTYKTALQYLSELSKEIQINKM